MATAETTSASSRRRSPLMIAVGVVAALMVLFYFGSQLWTDWLWYSQLGFTEVIRTEWLTRVGLFVVGALIMGAIVWVNLFLAHRHRPVYVPTTQAQQDIDRYRQAFEPVRRMVFILVPALLGVITGLNASGQWQSLLTAINGESFGINDPEFGIDISFYVFTLPFLRFIVSFLMAALFFGAVAALLVHYIYGGLSVSNQNRRITKAARVHVAVLAGIFTLLIAANYWLDRYSMISSAGDRFDGAGYTDVTAVIPARAILAVIGVLVAVLFFVTSARGNWKLPAIGVALMVVSGLVLGTAYPALIQALRVNPNEQQLEAEYIGRNIEATRAAYGLGDIEEESYAARTDTEPGQLREDATTAASIRILDPSLVSRTFRQEQQNKQYYEFPETLSVDRYNIDGESRDTVIGVREIVPERAETGTQGSWVNNHTVYTHGFGAVAAYGNTVDSTGRPLFFQRDIPSTGELGEYEPRIYFSPSAPEYSIVGAPEGTDPWELDFPDDDAPNGQVNRTFTGDGGPSIGTLVRQVAYTLRFGSEQILFSERVNEESQILYLRDPLERVAQVAPYLTTEGTTYPAVVDTDGDGVKEIVWIVDAYTTTNDYPYSAKQSLESAVTTTLTPQQQMFQAPPQINYIRNSVKAVVNAYDGSVKLFAWDTEDPILQTWNNIYPNSLSPIDEISGDLMSHLRYPEDMFKVQRELLTRYHVSDPATFYSGGDFWRIPNDPTVENANPPKQPPYYMTLQMPTQADPTFSLTSTFILNSDDRNVLTGYLAANAEPGNQDGVVDPDYGKLRLLVLPRDMTVSGPGQVQNDFDAYPAAATELNLLSSAGSEVLKGNLLTLPMGGGLLYVQPVYVQSSSGTQFPILRRVLVNFGDEIGFAPTLDEALDQVFQGDSGASAGDSGVDLDESLDPTAPAPDPDADPDAEPDSLDVQRQQALQDASDALEESETAMAAGDWATYGEAQQKLTEAIERLIEIEEELYGPLIGDPAPGDESAEGEGAEDSGEQT